MHPAGFMPILDIQVRTEDDKIIYKFYKKEVSNSRVILNNSAMPMKVKRITCVQEVIRRLRNTQRDMDWSVKRDILSEFAWSLHLSGYSEQFRYDVIQSGIKGYEAQCSASDAGKTPLYRDRYWDRSGRRQKKLLGPTTWYGVSGIQFQH